jgi:hypothetical protein
MAVVRCPKHDVPYNDQNPRGCPACWQEKIGEDPSALMRELARASRDIPRVEILPPPSEDELPALDRLSSSAWPPPVTQPPRAPTPEPTRLEKFGKFVRKHLPAIIGTVVIVVASTLLWLASRPTFERALIPAPAAGDALPFPVNPNTPIIGAFAMFGPQTALVHPTHPALARYDFGLGATVDVLNGVVYAITLSTPARSWQGNRVGVDERRARGGLALLGPVTDSEPAAAAPFPFGGYLTYGSLAALPRHVLTAEVRPPNGCYDVQVTLSPQVIGTASRGEASFVAVARRGGTPAWVVHQVRVVSRALPGPYAGPPVCE